MKGKLEVIKGCDLGKIKNGECFVWNDDCETVYMKCMVAEKEVTYADLGTGELGYRSIYEKVVPIHAEFIARNLTLQEGKEYE